MENEAVATLVAIYVAIVLAAFINIGDGRSFRNEPQPNAKFTLSSDQFERALEQEINGWFVRNSSTKFSSSGTQFTAPFPPAHARANSPHKRKLHCVCTGGTIESASVAFGVSKTRGIIAINQVLEVLAAMAQTKLVLDLSEAKLEEQAQAFEQICGFPGVIGAIDGTLIRVARPSEYEGWYCRKGFPAVNMQAVVDSKMRFLSCSIRAGSSNDQSLWNRSGIRDIITSELPERFHLLGDSGYKLWNHLITPYPEGDALQCPRTSLFNYSHSRTRIVVERAFGVLKNRWRVLLRKVDQKPEATIANIIMGCVVLHNILIELNDSVKIDWIDLDSYSVENSEAGDLTTNGAERQTLGESPGSNEKGKQKRNIIRTLLFAADST